MAPDERVYFQASGELGSFKAKYADPDGEYMTDETGEVKSKERSTQPGVWRIFQRGEEIGSYPGDWKPEGKASKKDSASREEE